MEPSGWALTAASRFYDKSSRAAIAAGRLDALHPLLINEADGMPADELTIVPPLHTSDGTTAFATTRGFFRLNMEDFQPDQSSTLVFLEEIRANGNRINFIPKLISLPAGADRLEFSFTGLNFHDPGRLKFRNRIVGIDDEWVLSGDRRVTEYRNLARGSY